ncbi:MAG: DUF2075 domain-containing protein [Actinomycetota bacterium]
MHLYSGATTDFISDATHNRIAEKLKTAFWEYFRFDPADSEVRSWRNSLRAMSDAIQLAALEDHGIVVELQLPLSSKRLDCMITGHDSADRPQAAIVELKQWEEVGPSEIDDCVTVFMAGRIRDVLHPSSQVGGYERYLRDVHTTFSDGDVGLASCGFAHNMTFDPAAEAFSGKFSVLLDRHPLFTGDRIGDLADFLTAQVGEGDGLPVLQEVLKGKYRPHKRLLEHTARVIKREPAYTLLDEQQVAMNHIVGEVRKRQAGTGQSVLLVRGGPGTGKSVIAVNALAELSGDGFTSQHATGSKAFTENLRKIVGSRAKAQFNYFNSFSKADEQLLDVIVCDEAHRIRASSNNRFMKKEDRSDLPQVEELMKVAKVSVFFIDDHQVVRPGEVGSSDLIRETASRLGHDLFEHELDTQFRCGGSEAFVGWVENSLEILQNPYVLWDPKEEFAFDVVDSPQELESMVRAKSEEGFTARLTAGFCWPWSAPRPDGTLREDVRIEDWAMPWNAKPDSGKLAAGIPKSNYWASDPRGVEQVGCVYTAQGFEYDFAGVIFGRDLVWRPRQGWIGQPEFSHDSIVKRGATKDRATFTALVKNTYRVLLTRGLQGCYVYFEDDQTRDFILSRVEWPDEG